MNNESKYLKERRQRKRKKELKELFLGWGLLTVLIAILTFTASTAYAKTYAYNLRSVNSSVSKLTFKINNATKNDHFVIYISSYGGSASETFALISAIERTKAKVETVCDGEAMSAGAVILFSSDNVVIGPYCNVMIHLARYKDGDDIKILPSSDPTNLIMIKALLRSNNIAHLLSEKEVKGLLAGADVYILGDELLLRQEQYKKLKEKPENYLLKEYMKLITKHSSQIDYP